MVGRGIFMTVNYDLSELYRVFIDDEELKQFNQYLLDLEQGKTGISWESLTAKDQHNAHYIPKTGEKLDEVQLQWVENASLANQSAWLCKLTFTANWIMKVACIQAVFQRLEEYGQVIQTFPSLDSFVAEDGYQEIHLLYKTNKDIAYIQELIKDEASEIEDFSFQVFCPVDSYLSDRQIPEQFLKANQTQRQQENKDRKAQSTVRIDVNRMEELMNLVREMVIEQNRLSQVGRVLTNRYHDDRDVEEFGYISSHISHVIRDLQEWVLKARMLPIKHVFSQFPGAVMEIAQALGKDVQLEIKGEDTEIDRTVLQEIQEPLIQLIKNSIDHGIEHTEARVQQGKPPRGMVVVSAFHQDNHVILTVEDDGIGIDPAKVKQAAIQKNLMSLEKAEEMSEEDALLCIFQPGFSTSEQMTVTSGRGLGLGIVKSQVEQWNGTITMETNVGTGSRFTIKLPMPFSILTGLIERK